MPRARQATRHRLQRLAQCRCPVHGTPMAQVGAAGDGQASLTECTRRDCDIRGTTVDPNGPIVLMPQFAHLLNPAGHQP
jgi:hypothetical protein